MDDLLRDFLTESNENLLQLDRDIVALEQHPEDPSLIHGIFRTIHTIKGTCGFIGLPRLEAVAHAAESVLSAVRDGELPVHEALISDVLRAVDVIKDILAHLDQTEVEPAGDDSALIAVLNGRLNGETPAPVASPVIDVAAPQSEPEAASEHRASVSDSTLRVHVDLLDKLMTLVGELVLDRNRLMQLAGSLEDSVFAAPVQHLNRVTSDLQEAVMKTRMQPIGGAWTKLPRLVRDLAQASGKRITLDMAGADTELDRQILQAIGDPLTHMIRNSADHGIESPAIRVAAGKSETGTICLKAFHEGGHVIIEVSDDGAGISVDRVRQKAIDRGLVTREAAELLHDGQIFRFIFEPGFSTAEKLTNVSGRGVGMDVVRTNIERIGGQVELQSEPGRGTSVRVKIPLTLAIIPALIVTAHDQRYAIPQVSLLELVRLDGVAAQKGVEMLHGARVYRRRGRLLPLVYLREALGQASADDATRDVINIVVLHSEGRAFGLVVDGLRDTEEIVVKPLSRHVKHLSSFAGATIMGDGRIALILDVPGLARNAHVVDDVRTRKDSAIQDRSHGEAARAHRSMLVVQAGDTERIAIELASVNRLEEFSRDVVEFSRGHAVAQYRGSVIPLVHIAAQLGHGAAPVESRERIPVVVHTHRGQAVGLVVDRILDIVDQELIIDAKHARPGTLGTAVIQGRVTDVLDIEAIVADLVPDTEETLQEVFA